MHCVLVLALREEAFDSVLQGVMFSYSDLLGTMLFYIFYVIFKVCVSVVPNGFFPLCLLK